MRTSSQIAADVLTKLAEDEWSAPQMAAAGGGLGLGGGLLGAGLKHKGDIQELSRLKHERPRLEKSRGELEELLAKVRKKNPATRDLRRRQVANMLLKSKDQISPEAYYTARRGYEEGLAGLSRNSKMTQLLKRRLMHAGGWGAGLGLGAGVGAGLLTATGLGKFDDLQS